jgi:hypothetical protein
VLKLFGRKRPVSKSTIGADAPVPAQDSAAAISETTASAPPAEEEVFYNWAGSVDIFEFPSRVRGWVVQRRNNIPEAEVSLHVMLDGKVIGSGVPSELRPDVLGDENLAAGYDIICDMPFSELDVLEGRLAVWASNHQGRGDYLPIWEEAIKKIRDGASRPAPMDGTES